MLKENLNGLVVRIIALLLMTAFFLPLFYPQKSQAAFRNPSFFSSQTIAPFFSPPEPFQVSDSTSQYSRFNLSVLDLASSVLNLFSASPLPEGFEMTKTPTLTDKISSAFAPLFFAPNSSATAALLLPAGTTSFDFDGDGRADVARWQSASGEWKIRNSSNGQTSTHLLGSNGNTIAPADYDGDGKTDSAVFNASAGTWTIKRSSDGATQTITGFGQSGDKAVSGDYDGDGLADAAVYRGGVWYVRQSSNGNIISTSFGTTGDIPVAGNYDGDSRMDYAVFRPSDGVWYILGSSAGFFTFHWGLSSDIPVPADYDGDNKTDFAVYRPTSGTWYAYKSSTNDGSYIAQNWGNYGDQPVPADYDGDNKADFAVWRPTTGVWYSIKSSDGSFDYKTLGVAGDTPVPAAYLKQTGAQVSAYDLAKARLSPKNATGGTNLYSRNFGWSSGLVGLAGRAGFDAGFGVSYNSLVWTKQGNAIIFDADNSNISPGARFGFPTIEPAYYDSQTGRFAYLMVSPSGARTEFRQIGASRYYETADSSYAQLYAKGAKSPNTPVEDLSITVTGTDGTKMRYAWIAGAFRLSQIKDSNGNFITVSHDEQGLLRTVTDTLGRVITINYDNQLYPTTITQTWQNGTHTYATFSYTTITINTNFDSSLAVFGPANGTTLKVLNKITVADGGSTRFDYNSYGQVWRVNSHAADNHKLNHLVVNLDSVAQTQTDCPRFSETKSYVENFNNGNEVIIPNLLQENQTYNVPGASGTGTLIQVTAPNGVISKTYVGSAGWQEGLPIATEDWANEGQGLQRKRWTWTNYTQDDPSLLYTQNPRITETKVGDETNTRRTTFAYHSQFGLVNEVKVYDLDQTTVLKRATTEYNLSQAYLNKRIIGLPGEQKLFDGAGNLMSKVTYAFDEGDFNDESLQQTISPINYDAASFGASFIIGRGNLTSTTRWNAEYPGDSSQAITSRIKYNTAGAIVAQIDPLNRTTKIGYADSFNDGQSRNSFAYLTRLTDAAGNFSEAKYRFDTGANVWAKSPAPAGNTIGKETTRIFDSLGRLEKEIVLNTGAYTRYEYPQNQIQSKVFTTLVDTNNNGADTADEVLAESWTDGAGRVRQSRTEHPNSAGGYSGSLVEYDILGRVKRSTVPTEIDANWNPAGDDLVRGWLWQAQEYDWKNRVKRVVNTDGTDTLTGYEGCGCAGGQIITIQDESVPVPGQAGSARRTQKIYQDILGRTYKTAMYNWDGTSVYATNINNYNGRDQVTSMRQYSGAETSSAFQETTMTYDGFGRLKTQHNPEQDINKNTAYDYFADNNVQKITDARGASTIYEYNSRGLVSNISYSKPENSQIQDRPTETFSYDAVGNPISIDDSIGRVDYEYDELSQIRAETRYIDNLEIPSSQYLSNSMSILYSYHLSGGLKSVTDPYGKQINYDLDKNGRVTNVSGTTHDTISNYLNSVQYKAFGGIKKFNYGNNINLTQTYNNRLQTETYDLRKNNGQVIMKKQYSYNADGRIRFSADWRYNYNTPSSETRSLIFDRSYEYDQAGRLTAAKTGAEARGEPRPVGGIGTTIPYRRLIGYDVWNNNTSSANVNWLEGTEYPYHTSETTHTYLNSRETTLNPSNNQQISNYDADGRMTSYNPVNNRPSFERNYDAGGYLKRSITSVVGQYETDVEGRIIKHKYITQDNTGYPSPSWTLAVYNYYLYSSVLGRVLTEIKVEDYREQGRAPAFISSLKTHIYAFGEVLATQYRSNFRGFYYDPLPYHTDSVGWEHRDPSNASVKYSYKYDYGWGSFDAEVELDPAGINIRNQPPEPHPLPPHIDGGGAYPGFGSLDDGCRIDGLSASCQEATSLLRSNTGVECPNGICSGVAYVRNSEGKGQLISTTFRAYGARGNGLWTRQDGVRKQDKKRPTLKSPTKAERAANRKRAMEDPREINNNSKSANYETYITPFDVEGIRAGIGVAWGNILCRDTVLGLLNAVASKSNPLVEGGDMEKLFALLLTQPGNGLTRRPVPGSAGFGSVSGSFGNGNASVSALAVTPYTPEGQLIGDIGYVFNELMHLAGLNRRITDRDFSIKIKDNPIWANSTNKTPYSKPLPYPLANPNFDEEQIKILNNYSGAGPWSEYFHAVVDNACFRGR